MLPHDPLSFPRSANSDFPALEEFRALSPPAFPFYMLAGLDAYPMELHTVFSPKAFGALLFSDCEGLCDNVELLLPSMEWGDGLDESILEMMVRTDTTMSEDDLDDEKECVGFFRSFVMAESMLSHMASPRVDHCVELPPLPEVLETNHEVLLCPEDCDYHPNNNCKDDDYFSEGSIVVTRQHQRAVFFSPSIVFPLRSMLLCTAQTPLLLSLSVLNASQPSLSLVVPDKVLLVADMHCPQAGAVIFVAPICAGALLNDAGPKTTHHVARISLVSLELELPVVRYSVVKSAVINEDFSLQWKGPKIAATLVEATSVASWRVMAPLEPEPTFEVKVSLTEDDKFISSAREEVRLLAGYNDGGRGDLHHFLAVTAEFLSKEFLFTVQHSGGNGPHPAKKMKVVAAPSPGLLRPLSGRQRIAPAVEAKTTTTETANPPPTTAAAKKPFDPLTTFMALHGAQPKMTWTLRDFFECDLNASEEALESLKRGGSPLWISSIVTKSLLPVSLLLACKFASKEPRGSLAVCVVEQGDAMAALLDMCAGMFGDLCFARSIPSKKGSTCVVMLDDSWKGPCSRDVSLLLFCGSGAFVAAKVNLFPDSNVPVVYAMRTGSLNGEKGPWKKPPASVVTLDVPSAPIVFGLCPLRDGVRSLVALAEKQLDDDDDVPCSSLVVEMQLARLIVGPENVKESATLFVRLVGKRFVELLSSQSVDRAAAFLESAFQHPIYGEAVRTSLGQVAVEIHSQQQQEQQQHPKDRILSASTSSTTVLLLAGSDAQAADFVVQCAPRVRRWCKSEATPEPGEAWIATTAQCIREPMFPWSAFGKLVILDAGDECAADCLELMKRRQGMGRSVIWALTDYEALRCPHVCGARTLSMMRDTTTPPPDWQVLVAAERGPPSSLDQVVKVLDLRIDWKADFVHSTLAKAVAAAVPPRRSVAVVGSFALLQSSPDLASSLSTVLKLDLVMRATPLADLIVDESRCVLVRQLDKCTVDTLSLDLFRASLAFDDCVLILRHAAPLQEVPARVLRDLFSKMHLMESVMRIRLVLAADGKELELELMAIQQCVSDSLHNSSLKEDPQKGWLQRQESHHERILCAIPVVSPLVAQLILSRLSNLSAFFKMGAVQAVQILSNVVPARVLEGIFASIAPGRSPATLARRRDELRKEFPSSYGFPTRRDSTLNYAGAKGQTKLQWNKKRG